MSVFLLQPPAPMRDTCCAGLEARSLVGRGGTAKSVPFATRVCAGGPIERGDVVEMLTHMAAIEREMESRLGDPVLEVAWNLWGGDPGREWAESFIQSATRPLAAAPVLDDDDVLEPTWALRLNALARVERELLARVHELCEAGMEVALARVHAQVMQALVRPSSALKAALGGMARRDLVREAMNAHLDPAVSLAQVPESLMAKIGPTAAEQDVLEAVFRRHSLSRIDQLVADHQQAVVDVIEEAAAEPSAAADLRADLDVARQRAMSMLMDRLLSLAGAYLATPNPLDDKPGEVPTGRVPGSLAYLVLSACGGGNPEQPDVQDWVKVGGGDLLASGVALGVRVLRTLDQLSTQRALLAAPATVTVSSMPEMVVTTKTTWKWGGALRPFEPHVRLDGRSWTTEEERDAVCRNTQSFPRASTYHPGDHSGCSCSLEVELIIKQTKPGRATVSAEEPAPLGYSVKPTVYVDDLEDDLDVAGPAPKTRPAATPKTRPATPKTVARRPAAPTRPAVHTAMGNRGSTEIIAESGRIKPEQRAQIDTMIGALGQIGRATNEGGQYTVKLVNAGQMPLKGALGLAHRGYGNMWINVTDAKGIRPMDGAGGGVTGNAARVTDLEYTAIHEWGHTVDVDVARTERVFQEFVSSGVKMPSGYGASNGAEMYAEAFADFHINPATAHPTSERLAAEFGWSPPATPLAERSILRK